MGAASRSAQVPCPKECTHRSVADAPANEARTIRRLYVRIGAQDEHFWLIANSFSQVFKERVQYRGIDVNTVRGQKRGKSLEERLAQK